MIEYFEAICAAIPGVLSASLPYVSAFGSVASVAVAWKVYHDQSSPDVVAHLAPLSEGSKMIALYVENIGAAPAYDVSIEVVGELPVLDDFAEATSTFLDHGVSLLMPGARRGTLLGMGYELMSTHRESKAIIAVKFARRRGGWRTGVEFPVDVLSFECSLNDNPVELQKIDEAVLQLERVAKGVEGVQTALQDMDGKQMAMLAEGMKQ